MTYSVGDKIKVWFRFVPCEGWLPQDTEGLWGTKLGEDTAVVENVALLRDGVAEDSPVGRCRMVGARMPGNSNRPRRRVR